MPVSHLSFMSLPIETFNFTYTLTIHPTAPSTSTHTRAAHNSNVCRRAHIATLPLKAVATDEPASELRHTASTSCPALANKPSFVLITG
jgi:hypothetical protein